MDNLFSTHPNMDNRIAELEKLEVEFAEAERARGNGSAVAEAPWLPSQQLRERDTQKRGPWGSAG